jgi:hypothetical protein
MRIVSLYDLMREYAISELVQMVRGLLASSGTLKADAERTKPPSDREWLVIINAILNGIQLRGGEIEFDSSLQTQMVRLREDLSGENCLISAQVISVRIDTIVAGIIDNLESRKFMFVPSDQAAYWGSALTLGESLRAEFSLAALGEATEAGNCYAAGRWTACVFHCMRLAEHGLRKLAKRVHVTLNHKGKNYPVEYADWEAVITAIKNKITQSRQIPRGPKKVEELRFYSSAADQCEYMKDIWRNEISHTRRQYSKPESLAVINRVREFIESLSKP